MTAPVIPTTAPSTPVAPVAPATPAPSPDVTQEGRYGVDNAIAEITRSAIEKTIADTTPEDDQPRDPRTGKFVPKVEPTPGAPMVEATAAAPAPAVAPPAQPTEDAPEAPATPELPEGYVLAPKVEGRELKTQFKVLDQAGTELEIPELMIAFKANGKERQASLDHVVKMAEWGVYNQERHEQMERAVQESNAVRDQYEQIVSYATRLEAERESLLSNDDFYLRTRAQYESQNTPEARIQRATQEAERARQEAQLTHVHAQGTQFYNAELLPAVNTIAKALPHVSDEEIGAKLLLISDRFKVQSPSGAAYIPPQQYHAIRQAIVLDVVPWAQQLNDHREHERSTLTKTEADKAKAAEAKARTAQIDAQKAKTLIGRQTRPATRGPNGTPSTNAKPAPAPIRTVEDAEQAAVREAVAAALGG